MKRRLLPDGGVAMFSSNSSQVSDDKLFVEDCFSCFVYTGNGSTQTITNGIDLAGKGGMVWIKARSAASSQRLYDTIRGADNAVFSNLTNAQTALTGTLPSFTSSGFSVGAGNSNNGDTYASWTFRKAPKFFDVVTWTGNGTFKRTLNHSLGVDPGFIIVKRTDTSSNWWTYHRGVSGSINGYLNLTNAFTNSGYVAPGSILFSENPAAVFNVFNAGSGDDLNVSGATYVAYLFAHDTTSDGIIQCGSYTGNGYSGAVPNTVTLGWEPQWVMIKKSSSGTAPSDWYIFDNMRGMPVLSGQTQFLSANTSGSEIADVTTIQPTATGFQLVRNYSGTNANGETYVYIAIRRGPMKPPTVGTTVFSPVAYTGNSSAKTVTSNFPVDWFISPRKRRKRN